jgi:hypothetical protein
VGVAWIHTHHTGYALASFWHNFLKETDTKKFYRPLNDVVLAPTTIEKSIDLNVFSQELQNEADRKCQNFVYDLERRRNDIMIGFKTDDAILNEAVLRTPYHPHQLIIANNNTSCCIMRSVGFLDDESLYKMVRMQETDIARYAVALYGIAIQLDLLNREREDAQNN